MAYLDDLSLFAGDNELMGGGDSLDDPGNAWLQRTAQIESGNGRDRLNPLSGARGLYQFLPTTWDGVLKNYPDLGLTPADINSDEAQALAAKAMLQREVIPGLRKALGRDPTPQEIYTAWGLGTPDARKLFNAVKENPNALAPPLFRPKVSEWNKNIFFHDKEGTQPRTVSEVAQAYANLWSGAKEPKGPPMPTQQPPAPDDYDPNAGLARMAQMGQRVGQMQQPGPMPQQRTVGLDALSPYMQLAAQLSPQRRQGDWSDALLSAGIGMMTSRSPDFMGGLGQGLAAAQGTMQQQEKQRFEDAQAQSKLGLNLYSAFQKDETPVSLAKGAMLVGKDGRMIANNPDVEPPKTREVKIGDRLVTQEWNGAMWKNIGEADRREVPAGYTRDENGNLQIDPGYLRDQVELKKAGAPSVNVDLKGQTAGAQESAKLDAKKLDGMRSQADAAAGALDDINTVEGWLKGLDTGSLAPEKLAAQKFLGGLGINTNIFGSKEQVAKAEAALTIVNQMALKLRNPESGLGMPGAMSDKDLAFLKQSTVGLETTEPGRNLIIDLTRRAASRRMEIARMADEFYYQNDNSFKGWPQFLKQWRDANPLFSDADIAAAKQAAGAPQSGALPSRGLPESDAEHTRRLDQERQNDDKRRGVYTPGTTIPLPPPPSQAAPQGQGTPRFTDPNDPDLAKLPPGTVFIDGNGVPRVKP